MNQPQQPRGIVSLVGAGPGDPGLITVKGLKCLRQAEVVVYDCLINLRLLEEAPPEAERIHVGKRAGSHTLRQEEINALLIRKASEGKRVVRLKGGDPFVFGRGGEEALALAEAGIPFEVVPGITAAVAAPAYAGIPVTHRKLTSTFALVTGHEDPDKAESDINWEKLATAAGTQAFYMGVSRLASIAAQLIRHGKPEQTPIAVIQWGTCPNQKTLVGTLENIARLAEQEQMEPPAMILVGEVVHLREKLNWFERRPLFGKRILVTRSRAQASELTGRLEAFGAEVIEFPVIEIAPPESWEELDNTLARLEDWDWIVFTSVHGVRFFLERLEHQGGDLRDLKGCRLAAIGEATANELQNLHLRVDLIPERYVAEDLVEALASIENLSGKRILLPRADIARKALPEGLSHLGAQVREVVAYRTLMGNPDSSQVRNRLQAGQMDWITLTASSTVRNLFELLAIPAGNPAWAKVRFASIGPITSATLRTYGFEPTVECETHTIPALVEAILLYETSDKGYPNP